METKKLALTHNLDEAIYINNKPLYLKSIGGNEVTIEYEGKLSLIQFDRYTNIDKKLAVTIKYFKRTEHRAKILFLASDKVKILREKLWFNSMESKL